MQKQRVGGSVLCLSDKRAVSTEWGIEHLQQIPDFNQQLKGWGKEIERDRRRKVSRRFYIDFWIELLDSESQQFVPHFKRRFLRVN